MTIHDVPDISRGDSLRTQANRASDQLPWPQPLSWLPKDILQGRVHLYATRHGIYIVITKREDRHKLDSYSRLLGRGAKAKMYMNTLAQEFLQGCLRILAPRISKDYHKYSSWLTAAYDH